MPGPTDREIEARLIALLTAGFNRSIGALEDAGAVDTRIMRQHYRGVGSKYYDLVTEQIVLTAKYGVRNMRELFRDGEAAEPK